MKILKKALPVLIIFVMLFSSADALSFLENRGTVKVIMYHRICTDKNCKELYCITPEEFENDLKYYKNRGYKSAFASSLADLNRKGNKYVVITFDDGYKSDIEYAYPLLEKYGYCATFFVFGEAVGTDRYMTADDIKTLSQKKYAEIGNHTYKLHSKTPAVLNKLYSDPKSEKLILDDFKTNTEYLEKITGKKIITASYPNGEYSHSIDKKLKLAGYKTTFSTEYYSFTGVYADKPIGRITRSKGAKIEYVFK